MSLQHQRLQDEFQLRKSIASLSRSSADRGITDAMEVLKEVRNDTGKFVNSTWEKVIERKKILDNNRIR